MSLIGICRQNSQNFALQTVIILLEIDRKMGNGYKQEYTCIYSPNFSSFPSNACEWLPSDLTVDFNLRVEAGARFRPPVHARKEVVINMEVFKSQFKYSLYISIDAFIM